LLTVSMDAVAACQLVDGGAGLVVGDEMLALISD
jgi:hypothetical protein